MPAGNAILRVQVLVDAAKAKAGMNDAAGGVSKWQRGLGKAMLPAGAVLAGVAAFGKAAGTAASDVQQAFGGIDAVFGKSAGKMKAWATDAAQSAGLAKAEYGDLATLIGSQLKNAGLPMDQVANKTNDLIKLGADLAATYGGTTADAVAALSSGLKGEADPLEAYGVGLSAAAIDAQQLADGTKKMTGAAGKAARTNATLALVTKQTADAHGKFAAEADTVAGKQARATAEYENAQATLGTALLPAMTAVADIANKLATFLGQNAAVMVPLIGAVVALAAAVVVVNAVMGKWQAIVKIATAVQWAWNAAMAANPVVLLVLAVVALVVAIVLLWKNSKAFRAFILKMWDEIKAAAQAVARALLTAWNAAWGAIKAAARSVASAVTGAFNAVWSGIRNGASAAVAWVREKWSGIRTWFSELAAKIAATMSGLWDKIKTTGKNALNALLHPIDAVKSAFDAVVHAVESVIGWIGKIHFPKPPAWLSKLPGVGSLAGGQAAGASLMPATRATVPAGGGGLTINLYGVLDAPDAARKIRAVLRDDERRRAGIRTTGARRVAVT